MTRILRVALVFVLAAALGVTTSGLALADINNSTGTNVQSGNNRSTTNQGGMSKSGDAVGGQVIGVVSSGRTSVDARNTSSNSDVTSGDARGGNSAGSFTGLNTSFGSTNVGTTDITGVGASNLQDGDNASTLTQAANDTTGDGVAGEVIGVVTATGGSASIVAANTSTDDSVQTGDARSTNGIAAFTGLDTSVATVTVAPADITNSCNTPSSGAPVPGCDNAQSGDNRTTANQTSTAHTGDGVAGQVIGAVAAGATSIDATNTSSSVDVTTGEASTDNGAALFDGEGVAGATTNIGPADVTGTCSFTVANVACGNIQDGSNRTTATQSANAATGDGVGGQVIGAVTSAGGSASIVAANTSTNSDITTGDARSVNDLAAFVGQNIGVGTATVAADISGSCDALCFNVQNGDNGLNESQTATSDSGDGVGGQVLGVVSAGAASLDATNRTDDSSVQTGDSNATNAASELVGLNFGVSTTTVGGPLATDVTGATAFNLQDGSNRRTLSQSANATSGDGVAGQVSGVVTSAGGTASVVIANTSTNIDSTSGDAHFDNTDAGFVGLDDTSGALSVV